MTWIYMVKYYNINGKILEDVACHNLTKAIEVAKDIVVGHVDEIVEMDVSDRKILTLNGFFVITEKILW